MVIEQQTQVRTSWEQIVLCALNALFGSACLGKLNEEVAQVHAERGLVLDPSWRTLVRRTLSASPRFAWTEVDGYGVWRIVPSFLR